MADRAGRGIPLPAAVLAVVLGLAATAVGAAIHVPRIVLGRARPGDYLGALLAVAGIALVTVGFVLALRGRSRWAKLLAIPAALVLLQWFVVPLMAATLAINAPARDAPRAEALGIPGARDARFRARDGVRLDGWYVPGRTRATVVLAHGSHGSRADTVAHLRLLARAGYGVLAFDARGHGSSGGDPSALGWHGSDDVAGAVAFLRRRPEVDASRIALLGLSMGGEEGLRAAADGVPLSAVVADGAGASTLGDQRHVPASALERSVAWLGVRATEVLSGDREPPALAGIAGRIHIPVLLIASGARDELRIDRVYRDRIGSSARLWSVPDAGHTQALARHPGTYAARVLGLLAAPRRAAATGRESRVVVRAPLRSPTA